MEDARDRMKPLLPASLALSLRSFRRAPGFVAVATLSLGAALGLSAAVFALMDTMTHPSSPYHDVDQLYRIGIAGRTKLRPSRREIEESMGMLRGVARLATSAPAMLDVEMGATTEATVVSFTRPGYFELLELQPRLGRLPRPGEHGVAVVSGELWRRKFENRSRIDREAMSIAGQIYPVIGVFPDGSHSGAWGIWIPDPAPDQGDFGEPIVRLEKGASARDVDAQLKAIAARLTQQYAGPTERPYAAWLQSFRPDPLQLKDFHRAMIGAAICVLLIACANVSALTLARGLTRRRDHALRLALGATRLDIAREVVTETAALAVIGSVAGSVVATWAVGLMTRATPDEMRWLGFAQPQWSVRVLAWSALALMVSVAVAGGVPAWMASRTNPAVLLKESTGGSTSRAGTRFRWLVMAELALSMTLLVSTSLMLKSSLKMARYDFGYDARGLLLARANFGWGNGLTVAERRRMLAEALDRIRAAPGVANAAALSKCSADHDVVTTDRTVEGGAAGYLPRGCTDVSPHFFETLGVRMADGRDFSEGDGALNGAVILDEKTAKRLFPHERAVGRTLKLGDLASGRAWLTVVGVVRNQALGFNAFPEMGADTSDVVYATLARDGRPRGEFVIRPQHGAVGVPVAIEQVLRAALGPRTFVSVRSWVSDYETSLRAEQFLTLVFALLGAASVALGAAGLYSVISYVTRQRMREFAVRIALGATQKHVLGLVMREAIVMALGGTAVGAALGMWAGFLLWDKMWGVYPVDVGALIGAEVVLLFMTLLASSGPARKATLANPVDVLRAS